MNTPFRLTLAAAVLSASSLALAKPPGPPAPEQMLDRLSVDLQLSDTQEAAILEILEAAAPDPQRRQDCPSEEERKAKRDAIDQQIASVLNNEQRQRFGALRAERPAPPRDGRPKPGNCS